MDYTTAIEFEAAAWAAFFGVTDVARIESRKGVMRANVAVGHVAPLAEFVPVGPFSYWPLALAKPDNAADMTVTLDISGNRLVSILNALDGAMHALGRYRLEGNDVVADDVWYRELRQTTEMVRDELSRQRCAKREG